MRTATAGPVERGGTVWRPLALVAAAAAVILVLGSVFEDAFSPVLGWLGARLLSIVAVTLALAAFAAVMLVQRRALRERIADERAARLQLEEARTRLAERTNALERAQRELLDEIGSRRRAEAALRLSEAQHLALLDAIPDSMLLLDGELRVIDVRDKEPSVLRSRAGSLVGCPLVEVVPADLAVRLASAFEHVRTTHSLQRVDYEREENGTRIAYEARVAPCGDDCYLVILRDVTEQRRTEEQRLQARKIESVGRLAGGVAHDFNNLLTAMLGYTELALSEAGPGSDLERYLANVRSAIDRADRLTSQLLAFARRQIIAPRAVNPGRLVRELGTVLRPIVGEAIALELDAQVENAMVRIDPSQFQQLVMNLALNARDAMPSGGRLVIATRREELAEPLPTKGVTIPSGRYVLLEVADTGRGMTEEMKVHAFEPFFTTKQPGKGIGLGLATCYGIVKQNAGFIILQSEPGQGTRVLTYLPEIAAEPEAPRPEVPAARPRGVETVLLVEDEPLVRAVASHTLRTHGYDVLEAADGVEALRVAEECGRPIRLLLTDVVMPNMNGRDLATRMMAEREGIKVLFMSGYTETAIVDRGIVQRGLAFLHKPFSTTALLQKVRDVLDS